MKPCPICQIPHCAHERKFYKFGLTKLLIIQRSLEATVKIFATLFTFLPANAEMQSKLASSLDDLKKCQDRIKDVKTWCEMKAT